MININKYNTLDDYLVDSNVPFGECRVSQIGPSGNLKVMYNLPNVLSTNRVLSHNQLGADDVCVVVKDRDTGEVGYIPTSIFDKSTLDQSAYDIVPFVRFRGEGRKQLMVSVFDADNYACAGNGTTNNKWASANLYSIECDTTAAGSFKFKVKLDNTIKTTADISWNAGDTMESIATQFRSNSYAGTSIDVDSGIVCIADADHGRLKVYVNSYSSNAASISGITNQDSPVGATLIDHSKKFRYSDGNRIIEATSEFSHTWQSTFVTTYLWDTSNARGISSTVRDYFLNTVYSGNTFTTDIYAVYGKDGSNPLGLTTLPVNLGYRCGVNLAKYNAWATNNGINSLNNLMNGSGPVGKSGFGTIPTSGSEAQKVFYDSLDGTSVNEKYRSYLATRMMDTESTVGVNKISKDNGVEATKVLSSLETQDFDGAWIPCYPAARAAYQLVEGLGYSSLPTAHQIGLFMRDDIYAKINETITALNISGATNILNNYRYWSSVEYDGRSIWHYNGLTGSIGYRYKGALISTRPILVFEV